ncbi:MAG: cytochrome c3 family protein [Anaerolineae bacterium]
MIGLGLVLFSGGGLLYAAHLEDENAFCASCHTQPESSYYERTQQAAPVDLASAHNRKDVLCIECHSGVGVKGRLEAMKVGAGDLEAYLTGNYHKPAIITVPIADSNCLKCHADVPATTKFNRHFHAFLPKWQSLDPQAATCVDCHQAHATGGQAEQDFLQETPTTKVCQQCHNFASSRG